MADSTTTTPAVSLFNPPTAPARPDPTTAAGKATLTTGIIDSNLKRASNGMQAAYNAIRDAVYNNQYGLASADVYAAFQTNTTTGMTAQQLGFAAEVIKGVVNFFQPGTITDAVPAATITLPTPTPTPTATASS